MSYKNISIKLPSNYHESDLENKIRKELRINDFTYQINSKSLDARKKNNIHWQLQISVISNEIRGEEKPIIPKLEIPYKKRNKKFIIIGSGPAGFFSAFVLQKAGFDTSIIERGSKVKKRAEGILNFEQTGQFNSTNNYSFGEGGAGTFSDGKLTSRSKRISKEKQFILSSYIDAGAPKEIAYMTHPHLGSDNLKKIVQNLRQKYQEIGGEIIFETKLENISIKNKKITEITSSKGILNADEYILATGHSSYETYRMLINNGVVFRTKNFAIGSRVEHPQELINVAQWGVNKLPGVKAAEYRLASKSEKNSNVYTFCMCPGGKIVPASAYENINIVNGMSNYNRDALYANAAVVAAINPEKQIKEDISAIELLDWLENLEKKFYDFTNSFKIPYCSIKNFINQKGSPNTTKSSYPLGIQSAPLWEMLPKEISSSLREGLINFNKKIKGFETGNIMGLESKTSAPIQVIRDENSLCENFENLYIVGEGSGYAGGIISSAADGIKAAINIIEKDY
ncbi:MAG: NAD(P)/FAD-dependent oxidoreductase [Bacteroidota bacterium]|nr:NAD(P)/FAD-dependent oxidoreductase [Bacteroidota bacterium]